MINIGGGQTDAEPAAIRDFPAMDAVRAVRTSEVGDPPKPKLVSTAHLCSTIPKAAGQDRAGAADTLEGRRGHFVTQNPSTFRQGAANWATGVARASGLYPGHQQSQRPRRLSAQSRLDTAQVITQLGKGEALWCLFWKATARRQWSSGSWSDCPRRGSGRSPEERRRSWTRAR